LVQRIDHRRIEAILLVVPGGGAGFEVAVGPRLFPARGADTCHVNSALEAARARERFINSKSFQQLRQFIGRVGPLADERHQELSCDGCQCVVIQFANFANFASMNSRSPNTYAIKESGLLRGVIVCSDR
jgi:hypothetical protein